MYYYFNFKSKIKNFHNLDLINLSSKKVNNKKCYKK